MAISIDLEAYDQRRSAMLKLLQVAAGRAPFAEWGRQAEAIAMRKQEKLELMIDVLYLLLEDILLLAAGAAGEIRNADIQSELKPLAAAVSFGWIRRAVRKVDEMAELVRRNIQKSIALDAFAIDLRRA